jgi:hypothetical protein
MTAPVRTQDIRRADPLPSFIERCKAKARAWQAGEISLHDAVDGLQQAAEAYGLVGSRGEGAEIRGAYRTGMVVQRRGSPDRRQDKINAENG